MGECYIVSGKPRTGKTYYMVDYISKLKGYWRVYHNISGLKADTFLSQIELIDFTLLQRPLSELLTIDTQSVLTDELLAEGLGRRVAWVFDEAHSLGFGSANSKGDARVDWVAYHGHFGQRIFILSQDSGMIAKRYRVLCEYEIRSRATGIFKNPFFFVYSRVTTSGQNAGFFCVRVKKSVFARYQSEVISGSRNFSVVGIVFFCFVLACGAYYCYMPTMLKHRLGVSDVHMENSPRVVVPEEAAHSVVFNCRDYYLVSYSPGHIPMVSDQGGKIRPLSCYFSTFSIISTFPEFVFYSNNKTYTISNIPFHTYLMKGDL